MSKTGGAHSKRDRDREDERTGQKNVEQNQMEKYEQEATATPCNEHSTTKGRRETRSKKGGKKKVEKCFFRDSPPFLGDKTTSYKPLKEGLVGLNLISP